MCLPPWRPARLSRADKLAPPAYRRSLQEVAWPHVSSAGGALGRRPELWFYWSRARPDLCGAPPSPELGAACGKTEGDKSRMGPTPWPSAAPTIPTQLNSTLARLIESQPASPKGITPSGAIILVLVLVTLFISIAYWYLVPEKQECIKGGKFYCPQYRGKAAADSSTKKNDWQDSIPQPGGKRREKGNSSSSNSSNSSNSSSSGGSSGGGSSGSISQSNIRMSDSAAYVNSETVAKVQHHYDHGVHGVGPTRASQDSLSSSTPPRRIPASGSYAVELTGV